MCNMHDILTHYHNTYIKIDEDTRKTLSDKRDNIRKDIKAKTLSGNPKFYGQGSYMMRTLIKEKNNDYDIDDGAYFTFNDDNPCPSPKTLRNRVKNAIPSHLFNREPEVKKNCVRVYYNEGYHLDFPCYRVVTTFLGNEKYKLASGDDWVDSDPRKVTNWFEGKCRKDSNSGNSQLKRIVRYLKKINKSRHSWCKSGNKGPSGLVLTILAVDNFEPHAGRDDLALRETIKNISKFGTWWGTVDIIHPYTEEDLYEIEKAKVDRFVDRCKLIVNKINNTNNKQEVYATWDYIFNTDYFITKFMVGNECLKHVKPLNLPLNTNNNLNISLLLKKKINNLYINVNNNTSHTFNNNEQLKFQLKIDSGNIPNSAKVKMQVVNTGKTARNIKCLRGIFEDITASDQYNKTETLQYAGTHWVQVFVIDNQECIAKTKKMFITKT